MLSWFIVDLYCSELQLVVEIDWGIHNDREECDQERTYELEKLGLQIIRYTNQQILSNTHVVHLDLSNQLWLSSPLTRGLGG